MHSFRSWILGGLILTGCVLLLIFRSEITGFLADLKVLPAYFSDPSFNYQAFQELKLENQSLEARLDGAMKTGSISPDRYRYFSARVYSRYPFNDRSLVIIDAGAAEGLKAGLPVLAAKGVIFGKITKVTRTQSEVQTIFDPAWRESVRVGGAEALLTGGTSPELTLIPKEAVLAAGDKVTNLSADFPIGFLVGELGLVQNEETATWLTAALDPPYDLSGLDRVIVVVDFP
ncbi:MAG: hypothetical protein UY51_C0005G0079 [Candidatus Jorgensenbacteria bacterium GW2011_GWB1_49_9]|nr:MAG: hypothetical protein UY51_C0005G0079 [Candidatus Jorgensenbacteria bacterium GW2011_GWB1_49_9]